MIIFKTVYSEYGYFIIILLAWVRLWNNPNFIFDLMLILNPVLK